MTSSRLTIKKSTATDPHLMLLDRWQALTCYRGKRPGQCGRYPLQDPSPVPANRPPGDLTLNSSRKVEQ